MRYKQNVNEEKVLTRRKRVPRKLAICEEKVGKSNDGVSVGELLYDKALKLLARYYKSIGPRREILQTGRK